MIHFDCSNEIADHIKEITVTGGGYELLKLSKDDIRQEAGKYDRLTIPNEAMQESDSHEWVTLRPSGFQSCFTIDLMSRTPRRYDWQ